LADRRVAAVFLATAIAGIAILALFVYPGYLSTGPSCPGELVVANRDYCVEPVTLYECPIPSYDCASPP